MKYFSVAEAEAMIPRLNEIYEGVAELVAQAQAKYEGIRKREEAGDTDAVAMAIERSQVQFLAERVNERLEQVAELGAVPKGLSPALVDFPHHLDGQEVYLCWRLGEPSITHYHAVDDGFSGRKLLPGRRVG